MWEKCSFPPPIHSGLTSVCRSNLAFRLASLTTSLGYKFTLSPDITLEVSLGLKEGKPTLELRLESPLLTFSFGFGLGLGLFHGGEEGT